MKTTPKKNGGFTLVELIVVIAILAILAAVAIPAYSGYIEKAEKANDLQLLGAVSTAFNSACVENGIYDMSDMVDAQFLLEDGLISGLSLPGGARATLSATFTANQADAILDSFALYYGDNMTTPFKVFVQIIYTEEGFKGYAADEVVLSEAFQNAYNNIIANFGTQVGLVKDSSFGAMGANKLLGAVDDVTDFAALMVSGESGAIFEMVNTSEYLSNLAGMMGMNDEQFMAFYNEKCGYDPETETYSNPRGFDQILANSTVLSVANTVNSDSYAQTKTDLINQLSAGNLASVIGTITNDENTSEESLAAAALIYGLYTAYDPEGANNIIVTGNFSEIPTTGGEGSFVEYLTQLSDTNSKAYADMDGYFAALEIVNEAVSKDSEVANQILANGYNDAQLSGILGSVIGD